MQLLELLTQTPGVPGREDRVHDVIRRHVEQARLFDELRTDALGSLIGVRRPRPADGSTTARPLKVMLAAHMDQIGFLVSHVGDDGFLRINPVGGFDRRNLFARRVKVCTAEGDLAGVLNPAGKPVHIATEEEKKRIPEMWEFFVDLGLPADRVKSQVRVGDMVVLEGPFVQQGDYVVSQCLDNRIGCWAVIEAVSRLTHHACEIHAVWTVQEEVGLRGAMPAAFGAAPDIGISCDTTLCCKTPGVPEEQRMTVPGAGVCLKVMDASTIADIRLLEELEGIARQQGIKCQRGLLPGGGQDGAMIQRSRAGVRTAIFACPVKYIHTVTEMSHRDDLASYPALLAAYLERVRAA